MVLMKSSKISLSLSLLSLSESERKKNVKRKRTTAPNFVHIPKLVETVSDVHLHNLSISLSIRPNSL